MFETGKGYISPSVNGFCSQRKKRSVVLMTASFYGGMVFLRPKVISNLKKLLSYGRLQSGQKILEPVR